MNTLTVFVTERTRCVSGATEMFDHFLVRHGHALSRLVDNLSTTRDFSSPKVVGAMPQNQTALDEELDRGDQMSLAGRIKIGMAANGLSGPQELADAVNKVDPTLKLNRQTTQKWINGETKNIEPPRLFALATALNLDPEWLATKKGEPHRSGRVTLEHKRVIELYNALPAQLRRAWLKGGDAMLEDVGEPSEAQPFRRPTKPLKTR